MSNTTEQAVKKIRLKVECPLIDDNKLIFQDSDHFVQHGAYGKVCRAKMDGQEVAVKYFKSAEEKRGYKQELVFLKCLQKHDNIVHLFGTGLSKKSQEPYIVMEFAPYSLERVLHGIYPKYSYGADHVMHWSRQTAVGINYIHSKRILHRDIKSSNLLLFGNGSHLKLCDFGTCRNLETNLLYTASIGTVRYMAPEVIQGDTYTTMCDVFSFAITLWEMLARKVPSIELGENISSFAILYQMAQGKRPPLFVNVPQFINELLIRCWHQEPSKRLNSPEIMKKLENVCKYFQFGRPLDDISANEEEEEDDDIEYDDDDDEDESIPTAIHIPDNSSPTYHRTQSDLSHIVPPSKSKSPNFPPNSLPRHLQPPPLSEIPEENPDEFHFQHGYPPRNSYPPVLKEPERILSLSDSKEGHVLVDHEVNEIFDPHTDEMQYTSLDENRLRFDVHCQYLKIEQTYQPNSLPSSDSYRSVREPRKQQFSRSIQPILPDQNDAESIRMFEQFKKLSEQLNS